MAANTKVVLENTVDGYLAKADQIAYTVNNTGVMTKSVSVAIGEKENSSNKIASITTESTDSQYPSALAVKTYVDNAIVTTLNTAV